jgi:hypothetical protein
VAGHRGSVVVAAATGVAIALTACGGGSKAPMQRGTAHLSLVPVGTADVEYDAAARTLIVTVHVTGVPMATTLPALIRRGGCGGPPGDELYRLSPGVADIHGVVDSMSRVGGVEAVPASASLEYDPPSAIGAAAPPVVCGDLSGRTGTIRLGPEAAAGDSPTGTASLDLDPGSGRLTVRLAVQGLPPGSWHPAHIHDGSCAAQGPVALRLPALRADAAGHATVSATLDGVSRIGGWYVNVHRGPGLAGWEAAPLSCGDVARA